MDTILLRGCVTTATPRSWCRRMRGGEDDVIMMMMMMRRGDEHDKDNIAES